MNADYRAACPHQWRVPLARYLAGEISGELTLMHFAIHTGANSLLPMLRNVAAAMPHSASITDLLALAEANMHTLPQLTSLVENRLIDIEHTRDVAAIRRQFDRAVALAPEASVALYSLGSADILERATDEIVARLQEWNLVEADADVLDIGCGIGRIERALSSHVRTITGIDISPRMIEAATRRCAALANVSFRVCDGHGLGEFAPESMDLALAIDSFPYLVAADPQIAARHIHDASRILRQGGSLVIFNFSYRADHDADRADVARMAALNRFEIRRAGQRDLALWDGATYLLTRGD